MSAISQFFSGSGGGGGGAGTNTTGGKSNRLIFVGPVSRTWTAPAAATEVEVHCWGGGGAGSGNSAEVGVAPRGGGGGGGGYVRHIYPNSLGTITLSITVGGLGGTSSVTCPTQSPTSPISATGGSTSTTNIGAAGGSGSFTIAPGIPTYYTFAASGGFGGNGSGPGVAAPPSSIIYSLGGGGGAGGSPYGTGGAGANMAGQPFPGPGGGGGGWGPAANGILNVGGVALKEDINDLRTAPNALITYNNLYPVPSPTTVKWFSVEDIATSLLDLGGYSNSASIFGGGGGGYSQPSGSISGGTSLIAGGGGGSGGYASIVRPSTPGGRGCVIIYW